MALGRPCNRSDGAFSRLVLPRAAPSRRFGTPNICVPLVCAIGTSVRPGTVVRCMFPASAAVTPGKVSAWTVNVHATVSVSNKVLMDARCALRDINIELSCDVKRTLPRLSSLEDRLIFKHCSRLVSVINDSGIKLLRCRIFGGQQRCCLQRPLDPNGGVVPQ